MMRIVSVLLAATLVAGCYQDAKNFKITEQNKDNYLDALNDSRGLTVGETREVIAYQMRSGMAAAFGKESPPSVVGKTIGDLIKDQRDWEAAQKTKKAEEDRLAAEAKAKEDALAAQLRQSIMVSVYGKGFSKADFMDGKPSDTMDFKFAAQNKSTKTIRAFKGYVRFIDLFGAEILKSNLEVTQEIKPGQGYNWVGSINYNQFENEHQKLRDTDLKDLKVEWVPSQVIFTDGSSIGGGAGQ